MTDLLIRDVDVVDGTGAARYRADVLVDKGRITEIASPRTLSGADKTIAPEPGYVIAPGFIDMHAHSDLRLLTDPDHFAEDQPGRDHRGARSGRPVLRADRRRRACCPSAGRSPGGTATRPISTSPGAASAGYLDRLDQGIAPNAAYLVPQGTLRLLAVGADRPPGDAHEIGRMRELLAAGPAARARSACPAG